MAALYNIADCLKNLQELIGNEDVPQEMLEASLDELKGDFKDKSEAIVMFMKNIKADISTIKAEEERLKRRRVSCEKAYENLMNYLLMQMQKVNIDSIKTARFSISARNTQSVFIRNIEEIPQEYLVLQDPKVSKEMIKDAFKNGIYVSGAEIVNTKKIYIL